MFRNYLQVHRKGILVLFLFAAIEAFVFSLYRLPVSAVTYTVSICIFVGLMILAVDYSKFVSHHRELERLLEEISVTLDHMPAPRGPLEEEYQEILQKVYDERQEMREKMEQNYREMVDYYTIWVHQIKTPIAAMRLILQGGEFPECQELKEELQRIEQYVEMVLCYLRLDAGTTDYVIKEYDLDGIVRQAVRKHASVFIRKKLRLDYQSLQTEELIGGRRHQLPVRVVTDEKWLLFVIDQILSNALKYTNTGSITITMESPKTLCIADTGIGIAPEDLPRVFEKGYTGCNGRNDKKASGIGLYLCRRICRNLGHSIVITSTPGYGTEVRLDLKNAELEVE
ncbi:MAG: sensor histidine kinase [Lachnospiraceae bacterium]|nr:sensor histidine kinase [Lachnospiraceae bacterium]